MVDLPTYQDTLDAINVQTNKIPRTLCSMDFWGVIVGKLALTGTLQSNLALTGADVVVAGIPANVTIVRVVVMFMCRITENINPANINQLDGAQNIEVNFGGGGFIDAIALADKLFWLPAAASETEYAREQGTVIIGSIDVKATVTGNGICTFRIDSAKVDLDEMHFHDYQVGVRVYFTI